MKSYIRLDDATLQNSKNSITQSIKNNTSFKTTIMNVLSCFKKDNYISMTKEDNIIKFTFETSQKIKTITIKVHTYDSYRCPKNFADFVDSKYPMYIYEIYYEKILLESGFISCSLTDCSQWFQNICEIDTFLL